MRLWEYRFAASLWRQAKKKVENGNSSQDLLKGMTMTIMMWCCNVNNLDPFLYKILLYSVNDKKYEIA